MSFTRMSNSSRNMSNSSAFEYVNEIILTQLKSFKQIDKFNFKGNYKVIDPVIVRYFSRKQPDVCLKILPEILDNLQQNGMDESDEELIIRAQSLKYLCKNSQALSLRKTSKQQQISKIGIQSTLISLDKLISVISRVQNDQAKSEVCLGIIYLLKKNDYYNSLNEKERKMLESLFCVNIKQNVLLLLKNVLSQQITNEQLWSIDLNAKSCNTILSSKSKRKSAKVEVTKAQQKMKNQIKNTQSEEEALQIINLQKSLQKQKRQNVQNEKLRVIPDSEGSDQKFFNDTYDDVLRLYKLMKAGQEIKQKDKDEYLHKRFLDSKYTYGSVFGFNRAPEFLFIDLMISEIYMEIAKKGQQLNQLSMEKIMKSLDTQENVKKLMFDKTNQDIAKNLACKDILKDKYSKEPQIIKEMAEKLKGQCYDVDLGFFFSDWKWSENGIINVLLECVDKIRLQSLKTIAYSLKQDSSLSNDQRISKKLAMLMGDSNLQIRKQASMIVASDINDSSNYKEIFERILSDIETNCKQEQEPQLLAYLLKQVTSLDRCREIFNQNKLDSFVNISFNPTTLYKTKIFCLDILQTYVHNTFRDPKLLSLNENHLQKIIQIIEKEESKDELKEVALLIILFSAQKQNKLSDEVVSSLVSMLNFLNESNSNYIIITLADIHAIVDISLIENLTSKLKNHTVPVEDKAELSGEIKFQMRSNENEQYPSIATMTSRLIVESLQNDQNNKKKTNISQDFFKVLVQQLEQGCDKQTRISCAKSIYILSSAYDQEMGDSEITNLRDYICDIVLDIEVYTSVTFVQQLDKKSEISEANFDSLPQIYCTEDLIFEGELFTQTINSKIFSILTKQSLKIIFNEEIFNLIDHAILLNQYRQEAFSVLLNYTKSTISSSSNAKQQGVSWKTIPQNTIHLLENSVEQEAFQVILNVINNKQEVGEKTIQRISEDLYKCDTEDQRMISFRKLEEIDLNQDISDNAYNILEIERAAFHISENVPECSPEALQFLFHTVDLGRQLSIQSLLSLNSILKIVNYQDERYSQVFTILLSISENGQLIPDYLVKQLCQQQNKIEILELYSQKMIGIFNNIVINNQSINQEDIDPLDEYIAKMLSSQGHNNNQCMNYFIIRIEKGSKLSESTVKQILNFFLSQQIGVSVKERIAKSFKNIVNSLSSVELFILINDVLLSCYEKGNYSMQEYAFEAIQQLPYKQVSKKLIHSLLIFIQKTECLIDLAQKIGFYIYEHLQAQTDSNLFNHAIIRLQDDSVLLIVISQELIQSRTTQISHEFHEPIFIKFQTILLSKNQDLIQQLFDILFEIQQQQDIPESFADFVCTFAVQKKCDITQIQCVNYLKNHLNLGRKISERSVKKLRMLWENEDIRHLIFQAMKQQKLNIDLDFTYSEYSYENQELIDKLTKTLNSNDDMNKAYITAFVKNIEQKLDKQTIYQLFKCLSSIDSMDGLEDMIDFIHLNKLGEQDIVSALPTSLQQLFKGLKIRALNNDLQYRYDRFVFNSLVDSLMENGWEFSTLKQIIKLTKSENEREQKIKHDNLIEVLRSISYYKISNDKSEEIYQILLNEDFSDWIKKVHQVAISFKFQEDVIIKDLDKTISDFLKINTSDKSKEVVQKAHKIILEIKENTHIKEVISKWHTESITDWVKNRTQQNQNSLNFKIETLAVIKQAIKLEYKYDLTDAQLLSCILAIDEFDCEIGKKGTILQVATGEGKSTIVSVIAIYYALQDKKIDVITSSPILAERDAKKTANLFKIFQLNVSDNNDQALYIKGPKECYKSHVVYGEVSQFQFDILRDQFSQLETLGGRQTDIVIADEVDSMLIDDSSKMARLSSSVGGIDLIKPLYFQIWIQLNTMMEKIIDINGEIYLLYGKVTFEKDGQISLIYFDESEEKNQQIEDLRDYIMKGNKIDKIGQAIQEDVEEFIKKKLNLFIKDLIKSKQVVFPSCFLEFVDLQIPKWIDSIITALVYQENVHYIIDKGVIKPVDFDSTGLVQSSTNWSDGLHQFLQIKHGLKLTTESFTTNFISNLGYIKKYKKLIGLTGTLGSKIAKKMIEEEYKVGLAFIPTKCQKQYFEFEPIISLNKQNWVDQICYSAIKEASTQYKCRGVLIICETISAAGLIIDLLKKQYLPNFVKSYTVNDNDQEKEVEVIKSGEIIVATNLAGRGTDINTKDIQQYGGMHVIVTFIPQNQRVEDQAFGRTARQGKSGTGQLIVNYEDQQALYNDQNIQNTINKIKEYKLNENNTDLENYSQISVSNPNDIKKIRDLFEMVKLHTFQKNELQNIEIKDQLFRQFCELLQSIRKQIRENEPFWQKMKNTFQGSAISKVFNFNPSAKEINTLAAIEDQWAILLNKIDSNKIEIKDAQKNFDDFKKKIEDEFKNNKDVVIENPFYLINIANDYLVRYTDKKENQIALEYAKKAISIDTDFVAAAHVIQACYLIRRKGEDNNKNYKDDAIESYNKALIIISNEMATIFSIKVLLTEQLKLEDNCDLQKQLEQIVSVLGTYSNSIDSSIQSILKSEKLIQIFGEKNSVEKKSFFSKFNPFSFRKKQPKNNNNKISQDYEMVDQSGDSIYDNHEQDQINDHQRRNNHHQKQQEIQENESNYEKIDFYSFKKRQVDQICSFLGENKMIQEHQKHFKLSAFFSDLTCKEDQNEDDQAIGVLDKIVSKKLIFFKGNERDNISLHLKNIDNDKLNQLFSNNITFKEVSYDLIISMLKNKKNIPQQKLLNNFSLSTCKVNFEIFYNFKLVLSQKDITTKDALEKVEEYLMNALKVITEYSSLSTKELKSKINDLKNEHVNQQKNLFKFTVEFKKSNEISMSLKQELQKQNSALDIEFPQISLDQLVQLSSNFNGSIKQYYIEVQGLQEDIINFLCNVYCLDEITLLRNNNDNQENQFISEKLSVNTAMNIITNLKDDIRDKHQSIGFIVEEKLFTNVLEQLLEQEGKIEITKAKLEEIKMNIDFSNILNISNKPVISKLTPTGAKLIIPFLRKLEIDFDLAISSCDYNEIYGLFQQISIKRQDMEISKVKTLSDSFLNCYKPEAELNELAARGIQYLFDIREQGLIPWRGVITLAFLSAIQIAAGAALVCTGFGAAAGLSLITEGASDLYSAYSAYSTRQFSWKDYAIQKSISLVISIATLGVGNLKSAAQGISNGFKGIAQQNIKSAGVGLLAQGIKEGGEQIVTRNAKQILQLGAGKLQNLVFKQIGVASGQTVVRAGLNEMATVMTNFSMDLIKPEIQQHVEDMVQERFCNLEFLNLMKKLYTVDSLNNHSKDLKTKINTIVTNTLNPEHTTLSYTIQKVLGPLFKGILSSNQNYGGSFSMGMRIISTLSGLKEIFQVTDEVFKEIYGKLIKYDKDQLHPIQVLQLLNKELNAQEANQLLFEVCRKEDFIKNILIQQYNLEYSNNLFSDLNSMNENSENRRSNEMGIKRNKVNDNIKKFDKLYIDLELSDFSETMKLITDLLTTMILRTADSCLVQPWSTLGTAMLADSISKRVQHHFIVDKNQNTQEQNEKMQREEQIYNQLKNKKSSDLTADEKRFLKSYDPYNTIEKQINYNAKEYIVAYSQCEIKHYATQKNDSNKNSNEQTKEQLNAAQDILNGSPADLKDKAIMNNILGTEIAELQITEEQRDDEAFMNQIKEQFSGQDVFINVSKSKDGKAIVGHDILLQSDGQIFDPANNKELQKNDCAYAVTLKKAGKDVTKENIQQLRSDVAAEILNNPSVQMALEIMNDIKIQFPSEAARILREAADDFATKRKLKKHVNKHVLVQSEFPEIIEQAKKDAKESSDINFNIENQIIKIYNKLAKDISENPPAGYTVEYAYIEQENDNKQELKKYTFNDITNILVVSTQNEKGQWIINTMFKPVIVASKHVANSINEINEKNMRLVENKNENKK